MYREPTSCLSEAFDLGSCVPAFVRNDQHALWLGMHSDKRQLAADRIEAIERHLTGEASTSAEAAARAAKLGLGKSRFYQMIKDWTVTGSLTAVVPHLKPRKPRRPTLAPEVERIVNQIVCSTLTQNAAASSYEITARVRKACQDAELKPPAAVTIRNRVSQARAALPPGSATIPTARAQTRTQTALQAPSGPGDMLVLDHIAASYLILEPSQNEPSCAHLMLLLDEYSRLILGHAVSAGKPSHENARSAAHNAIERLSRPPLCRVSSWCSPTQMRIRRTEPLSLEWIKFVQRLSKSTITVRSEEMTPNLDGAWIRRIIGPSLGAVAFVTSRPRPTGSEAKPWPTVTLMQFEALVRNAITAYNDAQILNVEPADPNAGARLCRSKLVTSLRQAFHLSDYRQDYATECRRQSQLVAVADATDHDLDAFMDAALVNLSNEDEA